MGKDYPKPVSKNTQSHRISINSKFRDIFFCVNYRGLFRLETLELGTGNDVNDTRITIYR